MRHGNLIFDSECFSAADETGRSIRFTRAERMLLLAFTRNAGTLMSRGTLLDAVSGEGSDANDRNIDFLINRLRRKLGDTPRRPRFIATRYGEGYLWVATTETGEEPPRPVLVGPVSGLDDAQEFATTAKAFVDAVEIAVDDGTKDAAPLKGVMLGAAEAADSPLFRIELCFLEIGGRLDCAVTLRRNDTTAVVAIDRVSVSEARAEETGLERLAGVVAGSAIDHIWRLLAPTDEQDETPYELPPAVRLHDAAEQFVRHEQIWSENEKRLRARLDENPDDAVAKLMLATALHAKYIQSGIEILSTHDPRARDEAEIERLVGEALPVLQDNGIYALTAAKLLTFVSDAHRPVAMELGERAFRFTTAFAAGCALYGQLRMWEGDIGEAISLYDKAQGLSEDGSHFRLYLLVLKCQALTARGDSASVVPLLRDLCGTRPESRRFFSLFYDPDEGLDFGAERDAALTAMTPRHGAALLTFLHYTCARLFAGERHRRNIMATPVRLMTGQFGADCIPDEVRADIPEHLLA